MKKNQKWIFLACALGGLVITQALYANETGSSGTISFVAENAGVTSTTVAGTTTENFSEFTAPLSVTSASVFGGAATLTGGQILPPDEYGGVGTPGNFSVVGNGGGANGSDPATITFKSGQNFFGYFWEAADDQNELKFYNGSTLLGTFVSGEPNPGDSPAASGTDVTTGLNGFPAYLGNPNPAFSGQDGGEFFVYLDFTDTGSLPITSVVISDGNDTTGFESDDWAIKSSVPDMPGTLTLLGLGLSGLAAFGRRFRN
jgi:hypothetical protein